MKKIKTVLVSIPIVAGHLFEYVTMNMWYRGTLYDSTYKKYKAGFQVTGIINRSDFNVGAPDPFDISIDVMIKADGEFFKQ